MKDRKNLENKIGKIPLFELVSVAVDRDDDWIEQEKDFAVVEKNKTDALHYVSDKYNLVQIRDTFQKAIDSIDGDIRGEAYYHKGRAELEVYPKHKDIGIVVRNSVDGSYALQIDFSAKVESKTVTIPSETIKHIADLETYKRIHSYQKAAIEADNYFDLLGDIQDAWSEIVEEMGSERLDGEEMKELAEELSLGKDFTNKVENTVKSDDFEPMDFWSFMIFAFKNIHREKYKSEMHYREKVRNVADTIINECVLSAL